MVRAFLVSFALFASTILGPASIAAPEGDATAGKAVFKGRCQTCHGANGEGNAALGKALGAQIPPMSSDEVQGKSDDQIKKVITEGKGKMMPLKGLHDEDLANVIAFVRSFKKK